MLDILLPRTFQLNLHDSRLFNFLWSNAKKKNIITACNDMDKLNWVAAKCTEFIGMIGERKSVIYMLENHCTRKVQS